MAGQFEGHEGKEPSDSMFHPKAMVQAAGSPPATIQGFSVTKRKGASTPASFIKKVGG